jgi:hypothetical protein
VSSAADVEAALASCCKELIEAHGEAAAANHKEKFARAEAILAEKRSRTFALKEFDRKPLPAWEDPPDGYPEKIACYIAERGKVDEETQRLTALFREALALPSVAAGEEMDCPLCGSESALTPARIGYLHRRVADTEAFRTALNDAGDTLAQMHALLRSGADAIPQSLPLFIANPSRFRRAKGFRVERIRALLGDDAKAEIDTWLLSLRRLVRSRTKTLASAARLTALLAGYIEKPDSLTDAADIKAGFSAVAKAYEAFGADLAGGAGDQHGLEDRHRC